MNISDGNIDHSYKKDPAYRRTTILFSTLFIIVIFLLFWFSRNQISINEPRTITLYCFSAMESVMEKGLLPAFQQEWFKQNHERVEFITSFAGSGVITKQIMTRFPAEVAILSSELDARRLVNAGIISTNDWEVLHQKEKFCRSPIVIFVNTHIQNPPLSFSEIDYETTKVIIPDPLTSGEGQLATLAIYGSLIRQGYTQKQAFSSTRNALSRCWSNPSTSQAALEQFHAGMGDILLNFEAASKSHTGLKEINMIYPKQTVMTEPVAISITKNISVDQREIIEAFLSFLWSNTAQEILSEHGFLTKNTARRVEFAPAVDHDIFLLDSLGTANDLNRELIDPLLTQQ
ncbi:MAG: substrate-binding domain-containing protein [Candidatus Marinimicrobia bacterium]|nr:substrate-binding domain-containing protein [Candidatus Neomarinimicrobiota bacterium]